MIFSIKFTHICISTSEFSFGGAFPQMLHFFGMVEDVVEMSLYTFKYTPYHTLQNFLLTEQEIENGEGKETTKGNFLTYISSKKYTITLGLLTCFPDILVRLHFTYP